MPTSSSDPYAFVARCVLCNNSFSQEQLAGATACPVCGTKGVPMLPTQDVNIKINIHELRILCIWAENYARDVDQKNHETPGHEPLKDTVLAISGRLYEQLPIHAKRVLTLGEEILELAKKHNVTFIRNGKVELP